MQHAGSYWCTVGELALPPAAQVDQQKSRNYFNEARVICERDARRLWGTSLCGPMVFADARTQTLATNHLLLPGDLVSFALQVLHASLLLI